MIRPKLLLLSALLPALTGCLQVEVDLDIDAAGGGVFAFAMTMDPGVKQALDEMGENGGAPPTGPFDLSGIEDLDEKDLRRTCADNGVAVRKFQRDGEASLDLELAFPSLQALESVLGPALGGHAAPSLYATGTGDYILTLRADDLGDGGTDEALAERAMRRMGELDEDKIRRLSELGGVLMQHAANLTVLYRVTSPGKVIGHNADRLEDRTCVWELDSRSAESWRNEAPRIVFSGQGLDLAAPAWE